MIILYFLIPLTLILLAIALWAFFWAVKNDQFDDLEGPAYRILFDDDENDLPLDQRPRHTPTEQKSGRDADDEDRGESSDSQEGKEQERGSKKPGVKDS